MNPIVRKYLQKQIFTQKGAIGSAKAVQFAYDALETRMKNLGLDINLIKSEKDLSQALGFVKNIEDQVFKKQFGDVLKKKDTAKVFDLEGKRLDPNEPIMGGTQEDSIKKNIAEATKKGDFTGIANQVLRDPDIARDFMLAKKFPFRRDLNVRSGEDAIPLARAAKFDEETKNLNISLTPGKDAEGSVGEFVDQMKKFGVKDKDIQMMLGSGKSGQVDYVMEQYGLSASDVVNLLKQGKPLIEGLAQGGRIGFKEGNGNDDGMTGIALSIEERMERIKKLLKQMQDIQKGKGVDPDPEEKAEGGRIGLKVGSPSKRAFLKIASGIAATIAAIKSGLIGTGGKEATKQVVKETAKDVGSAPPEYFFKLVEKIKTLGDDVTEKAATTERQKVTKYKDYELTEDLTSGEQTIQRIKKDGPEYYDETLAEEIYMNYKPGKGLADEGTKGIPADEYVEDTGYLRTTGPNKGELFDSEEGLTEDSLKEIMEEVGEEVVKIKKASGGIARMLGE